MKKRESFRKLFWLVCIAIEVCIAASVTVEMIVNGDNQWRIMIPADAWVLISASTMFWCGYLGKKLPFGLE